MTYPRKYIYLINFFLKKRDIKQGGVEGFATPFNFTINELSSYALDEKDIIEMLDVMKKDPIDIIIDDNILTEPIVEDYKIKGDEITVFNCTTEKLKKYKKKIKSKLSKSLIELREDKRKIRYDNDEWIKFSNTKMWLVLFILHSNYPKPVKCLDMWNKINERKPFKVPNAYVIVDDGKKKKQIQNIINGLQRRMKKHNIWDEYEGTAIKATQEEEYKLII